MTFKVMVDKKVISYSTIKEACNTHNVKLTTYYYRRSIGRSLEESLGIIDKKESLAEIAKVNGISYEKLRGRLRHGWTLEQALEHAPRERHSCHGVEIEVYKDNQLITYDNIRLACTANGISVDTFYKRKKKGYSLEQILGITPIVKTDSNKIMTDKQVTPSIKKNTSLSPSLSQPLIKFELIVNGETRSYNSKKQAIESFGIKLPTYNYRINHGWCIEEALGLTSKPSKTINRKRIKVRIDNKEVIYPSLSAACRANNISYDKFSNRYHGLKMTIEKSLGIESGVREHCKKITVNVEGKNVIFESITKAAKAFGIKMATVSKRLNHYGFTIEQALNLDVPPRKSEYKFSGTIYVVTNLLTGKQYVGQTVKKFSERWEQHIESSKVGEKLNNESLPYAIWIHGVENFSVEILESSISGDPKINAREKYWIKNLNTEKPNGYNLTAGGGSYSSGGRKYVFKGIEYPSRSELCRTYNVIPATFSQRIKLGWSIEQALGVIPPKSTKVRKITVIVNNKAIFFNSIKVASEYFGIDYNNAMKRLSSGKTPEQAFDIEPFEKTNITSINVHEDEKVRYFKSIAEAARYYNVDRKNAARRIRKGWSIEQALGIQPPQKAHSKKLTITQNGITVVFNTIKEASIKFGLKKETVASRLRKGWTHEEALEIKVRPAN